ncbi:MAG: helix-turn-helix transcriptional regulator [Candidatus Acidiferrales bacterium]
MVIGERLKQLREVKKMSQGDIEKRTGLLRCYISRVENGHTVPAIETLEKMAHAMEVPMYQIFYDGEQPPVAAKLPTVSAREFGFKGRDARMMQRFARLLQRISKEDRALLVAIASKMASR